MLTTCDVVSMQLTSNMIWLITHDVQTRHRVQKTTSTSNSHHSQSRAMATQYTEQHITVSKHSVLETLKRLRENSDGVATVASSSMIWQLSGIIQRRGTNLDTLFVWAKDLFKDCVHDGWVSEAISKRRADCKTSSQAK